MNTNDIYYSVWYIVVTNGIIYHRICDEFYSTWDAAWNLAMRIHDEFDGNGLIEYKVIRCKSRLIPIRPEECKVISSE
jgi:hypothetical protein